MVVVVPAEDQHRAGLTAVLHQPLDRRRGRRPMRSSCCRGRRARPGGGRVRRGSSRNRPGSRPSCARTGAGRSPAARAGRGGPSARLPGARPDWRSSSGYRCRRRGSGRADPVRAKASATRQSTSTFVQVRRPGASVATDRTVRHWPVSDALVSRRRASTVSRAVTSSSGGFQFASVAWRSAMAARTSAIRSSR